MVTTGLRCAPLNGATQKTATNTAIAHPQVITIQPEPDPFVSLSTTFATTPSPSSKRIAVPTSSAMNADMKCPIGLRPPRCRRAALDHDAARNARFVPGLSDHFAVLAA